MIKQGIPKETDASGTSSPTVVDTRLLEIVSDFGNVVSHSSFFVALSLYCSSP